MKSYQRSSLIAAFCLVLVFSLSACQMRDNRRNLGTEPGSTAVQPVQVEEEKAVPTDQPTLPAPTVAQPVEEAAAPVQGNTPQPTSTPVAQPGEDPAGQDLTDLLNQLYQMNQSGDAFNDLP